MLRDTVTRDPGFVVVNILRDTLSSAVTSGADFVPIKDSIVNMFRDMEDLEQFGVLEVMIFLMMKEVLNNTSLVP